MTVSECWRVCVCIRRSRPRSGSLDAGVGHRSPQKLAHGTSLAVCSQSATETRTERGLPATGPGLVSPPGGEGLAHNRCALGTERPSGEVILGPP